MKRNYTSLQKKKVRLGLVILNSFSHKNKKIGYYTKIFGSSLQVYFVILIFYN